MCFFCVLPTRWREKNGKATPVRGVEACVSRCTRLTYTDTSVSPVILTGHAHFHGMRITHLAVAATYIPYAYQPGYFVVDHQSRHAQLLQPQFVLGPRARLQQLQGGARTQYSGLCARELDGIPLPARQVQLRHAQRLEPLCLLRSVGLSMVIANHSDGVTATVSGVSRVV
jgi:hypothetical protein